MPGDEPNVLFLTTDHQRADSTGMVQHGVEVTPNLNRLASQGVNFARAYTTCPLCVPARTALATGLYPTRNGVVYNDWRGERAGNHRPIHEYLADAGYDVGHIGVHHVRVEPELRERVQFARFIENSDYNRHLAEQGLDASPPEGMDAFRRQIVENQAGEPTRVTYSNANCAVWHHAAEHFKDAYFCREAVDFIRQSPRDRPFALFVSLWAPHPPLRVPEPYASLFRPEELELPGNVGVCSGGEPPSRRNGISGQLAAGIPLGQWRQVWAAHLGLTRLADDGIGQVLDALDDEGLADDTIVVMTTDHGDQLGQHLMYQKMEMYEPAIRVPMIWRIPGGGQQSLDAPVSHLDVLPTLLEAVGLPVPDGLDGFSLLSCLEGNVRPPERSVFSQYSGNPMVGDIRRAIVKGDLKYVYDPETSPELYDLRTDPLEMANLAADPACEQTVKALHEECAAWARERGDWVAY